jgi:hypothetical protein
MYFSIQYETCVERVDEMMRDTERFRLAQAYQRAMHQYDPSHMSLLERIREYLNHHKVLHNSQTYSAPSIKHHA